MKRVLINQLIELVFEPILMLLLALTAAALLPNRGDAMAGDAVRFSMSLWLVALLYRVILLQLPVAITAKYLIASRWHLPPWGAAIVNLTSLSISFYAFDLVFGGVENFFQGEARLTSILIFVAVTFAPFPAALIKKLLT